MKRKRNKKFVSIILLLIFVGLGVGGAIYWYVENRNVPLLTEDEILPILTVSDSQQTITPKRGGFEYSYPNGDGTCSGAVADAAHPLQWDDDLLCTFDLQENTMVSLSFNKDIDSYGVTKWSIDQRGDGEIKEEGGEEVQTDNGSFLCEPGYIYEVYCSWNYDAWNYGRCSWAFITTQNVEAGCPDEIVLVQYTTEGDAILTYLNYDGNDFYLVDDDSRDGFAVQGENYREKTFLYLKVYDITYEDGENARYIMLVNDDTLIYEKLEDYWMTYGSGEENPLMQSQILGYISIDRNKEVAALNDAVTNAILKKNMSQKGGDVSSDFAAEAHITYYKQDDIEENNTITVYAWALYQEYREGESESVAGSSMPIVMTFEKTEDVYSLIEYWTPKDGSYFKDSIDDKFASVPDYVREHYDIYSGQDYINDLIASCNRKAEEYFSL